MSETQEIVLEGEYGPGGSWDADAHVRLLRENGGASSGYTADLIERLAADLHSATKVCRGHSQAVIAQNAEITSLRAQLADARRTAIEECAKSVEALAEKRTSRGMEEKLVGEYGLGALDGRNTTIRDASNAIRALAVKTSTP